MAKRRTVFLMYHELETPGRPLNNGLDGDYRLAPSSKFKGKATDGRDPGADVDAVLTAIAGVR
jgi:hypothetical protein